MKALGLSHPRAKAGTFTSLQNKQTHAGTNPPLTAKSGSTLQDTENPRKYMHIHE